MPRVLLFLSCLCLLSLLPLVPVKADDSFVPEKVQQWSEKYPVITVTVTQDSPPYDYADENGQVTGLSKSLYALFNEQIPSDIVFNKADTWSNNLAATKAGEVDVLTLCVPTEERSEYFDFTHPALNLEQGLVSKQNDKNLLSMRGWNDQVLVGAPAGYSVIESLKQSFPGINVIEIPNDKEGVMAVVDGKIDVFISYGVALNYWMQKLDVTGLAYSESHFDSEDVLALCVNKDKPEIVNLLNYGLSKVSANEIKELIDIWSPQQSFELSQQWNYDDTQGYFVFVGVSVFIIIISALLAVIGLSHAKSSSLFGSRKFRYLFIASIVLVCSAFGVNTYVTLVNAKQRDRKSVV